MTTATRTTRSSLPARTAAPSAAPNSSEHHAADPRRWWGLGVIGLAQLMVVLDMTIVNIALPHTQADLHISTADRQWMITAYTLAFGGLLLLGGRISDLVGRKRTFLIGLIGFGIASAVGGAAVNPAMLFGSRAVQGMFAAILAPSALSLLTTTFTNPRERGKAFGIFGAIAGGGSAVGLVAGGLLTEYLNWRWCMYVNVPIAVLAALGAIFLLRDRKPENTDRALDIPGALLGSAGLVAIVYGLTKAESDGWSSRTVLELLIGGGALLVVFVLVEWRTKRPMLPLHVVSDRNRAGAFLSVGLTMIGLFGLFLFLTYFLQVTKGYSPVRTGLAFLPMTAAILTGSTQIGARLMTRVPTRFLIVPGLLLTAAGMLVLLLNLKVSSGYVNTVLPVELLFGLGMGMVVMPSMSTATAGVAPRDAGVTSATVNTAQQIGGSIGTALLNTIAISATTSYLVTHPHAVAEATVHGYTVAARIALGVLLFAALLAVILINARPLGRVVHTEPAPRPAAPAVSTLDTPAPASGLHGVVRGADGQPLSGVPVTLIERDGRQVARTIARSGGAFHLPVVAPDRYTLIVSGVNHRPQAIPVALHGESQQLDVRLSPVSGLAGIVRDARDRSGVAGALAVLTDGRGDVVGAVSTDAHGGYTIGAVPAGEYTLAVSHPARDPLALTVTVPEDEVSTLDIDLR